MKKWIVCTMSAAMIFSSCETYTGAGAYTGVTLGSILGSAIGGISDGPRGSDVGTIIGMAGGAVVGAAVGSSMDKKRQTDIEEMHRAYDERAAARRSQQNEQNEGVQQDEDAGNYGSGYDETNSGDDRIYDFNGSDYTDSSKGKQPTTTMPGTSSVEDIAAGMTYTPNIEIRNARFLDSNDDNVISRGELCKVIFEVINRGKETLYDVQPTVIEATGNKHIFISPGMHVERIAPGRGIRYTAMVKADNRLKDGNVKICISVIQGDNNKISKVSEFNIPTRGK